MKRKIVTNASAGAELPAAVEAGRAFAIQVAPEGRYPQFVDETDADGNTTQKEVVQILDRQAMDALVANFDKAKAEAEEKGRKYGVLVDADHSSETSTNTAAMGWVTRLYIDPEKGLMADVEPTDLGAEKINGKVYRFVSGAWTLDDENRPSELVSIGLTNKPNLPVAPMLNAAKLDGKDGAGTSGNAEPDGVTREEPENPSSADGGADDAGKPETPPDAAQNNTPEKKEGVASMDIKEKLGLPAEATDEEVGQAIDALIARCSAVEQVQNALGLEETATNEEIVEAVNAVVQNCGELQAENEEAEKARLNAEAEQLVEENAEVIPEEQVEEIKNEYVEDPEKAKETVANFRRVYERAVLNAAKAAKRPATAETPVFRNSAARRPVVGGVSAIIASCNGDPVAINAALAKMAKLG